MHEHISSFKQNPTQKFYKQPINFQKPQTIFKTQKPRSKCMKCMKKDRKRDHTSEEKTTLGRNPSRFEVQREKRVFGSEEEVFYRERSRRPEIDFVLDLYIENTSRWIEDLSRTQPKIFTNNSSIFTNPKKFSKPKNLGLNV